MTDRYSSFVNKIVYVFGVACGTVQRLQWAMWCGAEIPSSRLTTQWHIECDTHRNEVTACPLCLSGFATVPSLLPDILILLCYTFISSLHVTHRKPAAFAHAAYRWRHSFDWFTYMNYNMCQSDAINKTMKMKYWNASPSFASWGAQVSLEITKQLSRSKWFDVTFLMGRPWSTYVPCFLYPSHR